MEHIELELLLKSVDIEHNYYEYFFSVYLSVPSSVLLGSMVSFSDCS